MNKTCFKCNKNKSLQEFASNSHMKDGAQTYCKECANKYKKHYRKNKKEQLKLRALSISPKTSKTCSMCKEEKDINKFSLSIENLDGKRNVCRDCENFKSRNINKKDPRKAKIKWLRNTFNLTIEEYDMLHNYQGGLCAICHNPETFYHQNGRVRYLSVDHDHKHEDKTGEIKVRGLLCSSCNLGIGNLKDNVETLQSAINYLNNYNNKDKSTK